MRKGSVLFSLILIAVGTYAAYSAMGWKFKAALFPLAVSIPLIILVTIQLVLEIFGKGETSGGPAVDVEFASDVPPDVARRRAVGAFLWVAAFILAVYLVGFPLAVPIFIFFYLGLHGGIGWWWSLALTAITWLCFYGLFQRTLHLPFEDGLIQTWLGM